MHLQKSLNYSVAFAFSIYPFEATMKTKKILKYGLSGVFIFLIFTFSWRCSDKPLDSIPDQNNLQKIEVSQYDEPPIPIDGFTVIRQNLKYPEIARKAACARWKPNR